MMMRTLRPGFDRNVLAAPFGVMFRDRLDHRVVSAGLEVRLSDPQRPGGSAQHLTANAHGVFVAHKVRGMRSLDEAAVPVSPATTRRFDLHVTDPLGRYLPLRLPADLPSDGLFEPACLTQSPGAASPHVPLYSAAARNVSAGYGVVRADLRLASDPDVGAAWARLELWLDSMLIGEGVADQRGCALLLCPLPTLLDPPLRTSPPGLPIARSSWEVSLRAFWDEAVARDVVPDLCELKQMPDVPLLRGVSPATPLGLSLLVAGSPLVVRSDGSSFVFVGA
ncbi:hypothetical protein QTI24_24645 [Variovorax sp. J22P240]|uniref:hypothetical protein n=1 Tax=Variovorax sp. J22P240 TaxID=3053514 RepID=UPI00257726E8|nr:hypothetical protein [Variovorax sp. J22P240]MDM0001820.1 hypothetical protein [Variovorax sp. J22P240]